MPKYNADTDLLERSQTQFRLNELNIFGRICARLLKLLRIVHWTESSDGIVTINNLTLINFFIIRIGPVHEKRLTLYLVALQVLCSCVAFIIRYPLAKYFYEY